MTYKFKYHPDGWIGINGQYYKTFAEFKKEKKSFPLDENDYCEFLENHEFYRIVNINGTWCGKKQDVKTVKKLIVAINKL